MEYDDLGRIISTTDILGRTTRTEYSNDQLTTTVTTPSGAIFVTKTYYDGSTLWQGGNGQQEIEIQLELTEEGILTTTLSKGVILYVPWKMVLEKLFGRSSPILWEVSLSLEMLTIARVSLYAFKQRIWLLR